MAEYDYSYIAGLVNQAKTGDTDAFAELYITTYQRQYLFSLSYLKDEYLAQDALQETYILALKNLSALQDAALFISWLNQINFRVCYAMSAKQAKFNTESGAFAAGEADMMESNEPGPEEQAVQVDSNEYLMKQILSLPADESQAILLYYFNRLKLEEVAFTMGTSLSTVKRRLASGKKHLSHKLNN